jgi:hypothetical protein
MKKMILLTTFLFLFSFVCAAENISVNSTNETLNVTINESVNVTQNVTILPNLEIKNFFPTTFKPGDSQLNIYVQNNGPTLNNLGAFIEGNGYSTYNLVPISILETNGKNYIIVTGNFRDSGKINLTITINGEKFYQEVTVTSDKTEQVVTDFGNISIQLDELKRNYDLLEQKTAEKKSAGYDISKINLADLKNFIRNIETAVLTKNAENALVNLKLATEEYNYQTKKLESSPKIGLVGKLRENAVLFSTIAGALVTFFTLYELLKKKSSKIVEKVQTVKVTTITSGKKAKKKK